MHIEHVINTGEPKEKSYWEANKHDSNGRSEVLALETSESLLALPPII